MLAFGHIPTGAAASEEFDIHEVKDRTAVAAIAATAIGAGTEIGRATP
jgi:hypothetical protein